VAALNALPNLRPGAKAISIPADASKTSEIERLVAEVGKTTDHVDILFANAGATWGAPFDDHTDASFSKVMDLNVKSVFFTVQKYVFVFRFFVFRFSQISTLLAISSAPPHVSHN